MPTGFLRRLRCLLISGHKYEVFVVGCRHCGAERSDHRLLYRFACCVVRSLGDTPSWLTDLELPGERLIGVGDDLLMPWRNSPLWLRPLVLARWLYRYPGHGV